MPYRFVRCRYTANGYIKNFMQIESNKGVFMRKKIDFCVNNSIKFKNKDHLSIQILINRYCFIIVIFLTLQAN